MEIFIYFFDETEIKFPGWWEIMNFFSQTFGPAMSRHHAGARFYNILLTSSYTYELGWKGHNQSNA